MALATGLALTPLGLAMDGIRTYKLLELTVDPQADSLTQTTPRLNGSSTQC